MIERIYFWIKDLFRGNLLCGLRSPQWSQVRKDFLILHDKCEVCGKKAKLLKPLEVHHLKMFSRNPELELDFNNLITVCRIDHLFVCHLNLWKSFNENAKEDCLQWKIKITNRP